MTKALFNLFDFKQSIQYRTEILSGLTVAMALIPEAVAFAMIAGLSPLTGLYAAFVMGLVTSVTLSMTTTIGGGWFTYDSAIGAPDDDLRVLLAQITAPETPTGTLTYQVKKVDNTVNQVTLSFDEIGTFNSCD